MKRLLLWLLPALLLAQPPSQISIQAQAPTGITFGSASASGVGGGQTVYYYVIVRYPSGLAYPAFTIVARNTAGIGNLSASNFNVISWSSMSGATGYDVVRSATQGSPASPCTGCAVVLNTPATTVNDTGQNGGNYPPSLPGVQNILGTFSIDALSNSFPLLKFAFNPGSLLGVGLVRGNPSAGQYATFNTDGTFSGSAFAPGGATIAVTTKPIKGDNAGNGIAAAAADIVGLFSTCSGTQYLGADGACHNSGGGATIPSTTSALKGDGAGNALAVTGTATNFVQVNGGSAAGAPATSGSVPLKGNGAGGTAAAVASDIVGLFSTCSGTQYLGADGACHTPGGGGLADPGANGPIKRTSLNVTAPAVSSDIIGLFSTCSGVQYLGADGTCHTPSGGGATIASTATMIKGDGAGNGLASNETDNNATFATTLPFTAPSVATGTSPPAITAGTGGVWAPAEGTAPSVGLPAAGVDGCYGDSTAHAIKCSYNNAAALPVPLVSGSPSTGNVAKFSSATGITNAVPGTDYAPATSGSVPLKGNGAGGTAAAVAADIVGLFSTCSGTQYLGADGACHTASGGGGGGGTVVTKSGNYTLLSTDNGTVFVFTSGNPTLPATAPTMPWIVTIQSATVGGNTMVTTPTLLGGATYIPYGGSATIESDGTNYKVQSSLNPEGWVVGATSVTINMLVQTDASAPSKIIASTGGSYGIALATVATAGTAPIARYGIVPCVTDTGGATAGDLVITGTGTLGTCKDSGQTASSAVAIGTRLIGIFLSSASAGSTALVELTPSHFGTLITTIPSAATATTQAQGDNSTKVATTAYTDTAVSNAIAGVNPAIAVQAATTTVLPAVTYNNGVAGVGATLTQNSAAVLVTDGYTLLLNDRLLVKNQASAPQNGIYLVTTLGTGLVPFVLTRALDYDQPSDMNNTGSIPVVNGTANAQTGWLLTSAVATVGTDALTYTPFTLKPTTLVTATTAATAANQVCVASGASKTCSYIDFPERYNVPAANCNNTTAGAGWSIGASGVVTCRAGTNNLGGFVAITDTSSSFAQFQVSIPTDWDSATRPYVLLAFQSATDTTNGHTVIPEVAVSCTTATNGTATDDITLSAYQSLTTVTFGGSAVAHGFYTTSVQLGSTQMSGCIAGGSMIVSVGRATDTATGTIGFYYADVTFPRLLVVQAN